jgi:hypothetical protein
MPTETDNEVLCLVFEGPPLDQIISSTPQDEKKDHTFYYRMDGEPGDVRRMMHVLYYHAVIPLPSGDGAMATVVTTNHNPVTISYAPGGSGTFLARQDLIESRRL